ncbi:MAG: ShlB/FhaC/HecB family hemolysin secretion/activation protein [Verrucomicrobiota bacterium]
MNRSFFGAVAVAVLGLMVHPSRGIAELPKGGVSVQEPAFNVSRFTFAYRAPEGSEGVNADLPAVEEFSNLSVALVQDNGVFRAPKAGESTQSVALGGDGKTRKFGMSAIVAVSRVVVGQLNRRGIYGVLAMVDPDAIDLEVVPPVDARSGRIELPMFVYYSQIAKIEMRQRKGKLPWWERSPESVGRRILAGAPLHGGDLFKKDELQAYLNRVNRFDGRRVESVIGAGEQPGTVNVALQSNEQKRISTYVQTANSGSKESGEWRSRVGGQLRQLAGLDDVLSVDYSTSDFKRYQAFSISEDFGIVFPEVLRGRVYGSWSDLSLADLGQTGLGFRSSSESLGFQLTGMVLDRKGWPVSLTGGAYLMDATVTNDVLGSRGESVFFVPYMSLSTEHQGGWGRLSGSVQLDWISTEDKARDVLGRIGTAREAWVTHWNVSGARRAGRFSDLFHSKPGKAGNTHELSLTLKGQAALDSARVVSQFQGVAGGVDTVRGYRESYAAGDNIAVGSLEYRLRLNDVVPTVSLRKGAAQSKGETEGAEQGYRLPGVGTTQTDREAARGGTAKRLLAPVTSPVEVAIRGFIDGAFVHANGVKAGSGDVENRELLGAGLGLDVLFRGKLTGLVRADLGFALKEQRNGGMTEIAAGSSRLHLSVMLLW